MLESVDHPRCLRNVQLSCSLSVKNPFRTGVRSAGALSLFGSSKTFCPRKATTSTLRFVSTCYSHGLHWKLCIRRYYFKTNCDDDVAQAVYQEVMDESEVLPLWEDKVLGLVKLIDWFPTGVNRSIKSQFIFSQKWISKRQNDDDIQAQKFSFPFFSINLFFF